MFWIANWGLQQSLFGAKLTRTLQVIGFQQCEDVAAAFDIVLHKGVTGQTGVHWEMLMTEMLLLRFPCLL